MWAYLAVLLLVPFVADAYADSNPYLSVSAENPAFDNHFAGSMVVEVVVSDPNLHGTSEPEVVPNVTVNGDRLQMTQASNGAWHAYFANTQGAMAADRTVPIESAGTGLDFGVLCSSSTDSDVFGVSFSDSEGFFVPSSDGLGSTTGSITSKCTGPPTGSNDINVVRRPPAINQNDNVPTGQTGLDPDAWPVIQLFSFSKDVTIRYEPAGSQQQVTLRYDEIPGITAEVDRELHPAGSEVFVFVSDIQLNQDPTDWDSWTFQVDSSPMVFYHAFDRRGGSAANNPTDLYPSLKRLGFEDNGFMEIDPGRILEFKPNGIQPSAFASPDIITLVEDKPNSGMFVNYDRDKISNLGVSDTAPRGHPGYIQYNGDTVSVLTGSSTALLSTKPPITIEVGESRPGTKIPVLLIDSDQNLSTAASDDLLVSRASAAIPTIKTGSPLTLENAGNLRLYESSSAPVVGGDAVPSSVPDPFSARLYLDAPNAIREFEKISVNLGFSADSLNSLLAVSEDGSSWINLDLRSLEELGVGDFSNTGISLSFGSLSDTSPIPVVSPGDMSSPQQLLLIDPSVIQQISSRSGGGDAVFAVIDLGPSADGRITPASSSQPIVLDFFSFGVVRNDVTSNAVYRMELEEDRNNPGSFGGSLEYVIADPAGLGAKIADRIVPTGSDVVLAVSGNDRIVINYSDLALVEITILSSEVGIQTHNGEVSYSPQSLRFGHPVTVRLVDPDLNTSSDRRDAYRVIDDPASPGVDTVGLNGHTLLEVKIKNVRYQRCMVDGVEHGGLASTGFVLSETGPSTGVFEGSFAMPSWICDKTGSKLISPGGGSIDLIYHDSQDASGNQNIFSLDRPPASATPVPPAAARPDSTPVPPMLSHDRVSLQDGNSVYKVVMSGSVGGINGGAPLSITVTNPDKTVDTFRIPTTENGNYRSVITVTTNSLSGQYTISLSYGGDDVGTLLLSVISDVIPDWVRDGVLGWSSGASSHDGFVDGVRHMIAMGIIDEPGTGASETVVPDWVRYTAGLWAGGQISDEEFVQSVQYMIRNGIIRI